MRVPSVLFCLALTATLGLTGCGSSGPAGTYPVSGTVTYKGEPLKSGQVAFIPSSTELNAGMAHSCPIVDGKFEGMVSPGLKTVQIYSSWKTDRMMEMDDGSGQVPVMESLPSKHNQLSTLEVTLNPEPNQGLTFDLD